jgi:hypothetical protein
MWTRSDILALLQLLAMIFFATVHAAWCLAIHRGTHSLFAQDHVLIFLKLPFGVARMQSDITGGSKQRLHPTMAVAIRPVFSRTNRFTSDVMPPLILV